MIVQEVLEQATTVGSFQIAGHGIDPALFRRIDESYRAFLADPTKQDYQSDSTLRATRAPVLRVRRPHTETRMPHQTYESYGVS